MTYDRRGFMEMIQAGMSTAEAARRAGIAERTAYRWVGRRRSVRKASCRTCGKAIPSWQSYCCREHSYAGHRIPTMDRLFGRADYHPRTGCLLFGTGALHGYSLFVLDGRRTTAHRASYRLMVGEPELGMDIDHLCSQRRCIQPSHLEQVTHAENVRRATVRS